MTRTRKVILSLVTFIPILAMLIATELFVVDQVHRLSRHANVIIAGEISQRIGKYVRIGSVDISKPGAAVLHDIRIANGRSFAHGTLASARKVVIYYDLRAMIFQGKGASGVSEVDVADPSVMLVRRSNGSFNISDLLKPTPGPRRPPFLGKVVITGGHVEFLDYAVKPGERPAPITIRSLTGHLSAADYPVYSFIGRARGARGQFFSARFRGSYDGRTKRTLVNADGRGVNALLLKPYVLKTNKVQVSAGNLDMVADLDIHREGKRTAVAVTATASIRNATVAISLLRSPLTNLSGKVSVGRSGVAGELRGSYVGAPVQISGTVRNLRAPDANVAITSSSIDLHRLIASAAFLAPLSQFSPSGRGSAKVRLTGKLSGLAVDAVAQVPRASLRGVPVEKVSVSALYRPGRINIRSLRLIARGASVSAAGYVITRPATLINLRGQFRDLALAGLPLRGQYNVSGTASGSFVLSGSAARPTASVKAIVKNGSIADVPFGAITADASVAGNRITVRDIDVQGVFGGSIRATGAVSGSTFDFNLALTSVDIGEFAKRLGLSGYGGVAFVDGHLFGTLKSPKVEGSLEVFGGQAEGYSIDHARVTFIADRNKITISEGLVQSFPAEIRFSGEASGLSSNRVAFAGKASVQRLEMTKLLGLAKRDVDITGTLQGDLQFSGAFLPKAPAGQAKFVDLAASGSISLEDATAFGYPISETTARIDYSNNVIRLQEASIVSDGARLTLNGSVATDTRTVNAGFSLSGFDLARLHEFVGDYAVLAGTASATGKIEGPIDNSKATITAKVDGLSINYEKFERAEAQLSYDEGKVVSYSLDLARAGQSLRITGTDFDPDTLCVASTKATLADVSIPDVLGILRASPFFSSEQGKPLAEQFDALPKVNSGRVNGSVSVSGCLVDAEGRSRLPDAQVNLTATNIGIDVQQIQSIDLQASSKNGVVSIGKFVAIADDTSLEVTGAPAYSNGIVHLAVRAENFRLAQLSPWLGQMTPSGTLSAEFNIDGPLQQPDIIGSVDVVRPGFGGFAIDRMRASQVRITANRIEIPEILLSAGGHQATATASVPWSWSTLSVPIDEPLSVAATLPRQDLSILTAFLPIVDAIRTRGTVEASFRLEGTLLDPQMQGTGRISDGVIAITGFTNTFTNVTADVAFNGDRVVVNSMSAASSQGGTVRVIPGGFITLGPSGTSTANLHIVADRLAVAERNLLGMRESVSTQIDAGLAISGPPSSLTVTDAVVEGKQGGITLSHARLSFQLTQRGAPPPTMLALNPRLNVSVRLGEDVVVSPPSLEVTVSGAGLLTGTLAQPNIQGMNLTIQNGEISLATARLHITKGGSIRVSYAPPVSPDVSLDFQATASVFAINSLRQRERYQITMRVTGQASNPHIDLSSSPPGLTREQMLAALGHVPGLFTSAEAGLQQELTSALTAVGASTLFAPIENVFIQKLGFEQFSLEYSPIYPLSLYVSRHLFGNWYIAFYRQITTSVVTAHDVLYQVVLSYRLKDTYQFSIGADDQQTLIFQVGYAKAFR